MTTTVITTFSKDGYELYGKRMVETWLEHWKKYFKLVVYVEDFELDIVAKNIEQRDIHVCCPDLLLFKEKSTQLIAEANGDEKIEKRIQKTVKWSHKVFAIDHALRNCSDEHLIYLDGDTYTINRVNGNLANILIDKDDLLAVHFERLIEGRHYETGLIVFNCKHERLKEFLEVYKQGYTSMEIYSMDKTWDSFWLVHIVDKYEFPVKNLASKTTKVFNNPAVREILRHDVGPEKYIKANYNRYTGRKK
jgi:hypothetical protein